MKDPKTTIAGLMFIAIAALIWQHAITFEQALLLLTAVGAYLGVVSKDSETGSSKPTPEVDKAIEKVERNL